MKDKKQEKIDLMALGELTPEEEEYLKKRTGFSPSYPYYKNYKGK